jgi:hypothetical protein
MKTKLKPPGTKRLKLKCGALLSTSAFKFNLRRYTKGIVLGLSLAGYTGLWEAVVADVGTALIVILNGMTVLGGGGTQDASKSNAHGGCVAAEAAAAAPKKLQHHAHSHAGKPCASDHAPKPAAAHPHSHVAPHAQSLEAAERGEVHGIAHGHAHSGSGGGGGDSCRASDKKPVFSADRLTQPLPPPPPPVVPVLPQLAVKTKA